MQVPNYFHRWFEGSTIRQEIRVRAQLAWTRVRYRYWGNIQIWFFWYVVHPLNPAAFRKGIAARKAKVARLIERLKEGI